MVAALLSRMTPDVGVKLALSLQRCIARANEVSREFRCVQHVNFDVQQMAYYVSDWYNCDSTVYSVQDGKVLGGN